MVRGLLADDIPVIGALCFVEANWPLIGGSFTISGVHVLRPKRLQKLLVEGVPMRVDVTRVRDELARGLR